MSLSAKDSNIILEITDLGHDGRGIAFLPNTDGVQGRGKVVFVQGALPGQTVLCSLQRDKTAYAEASLLKIINNPWQDPLQSCPHMQDCGGCVLLPMPYAKQLEWKRHLVIETMARIGRIDREFLQMLCPAPARSPQITAYRNRTTFALGQDATGRLVPGFRKPSSHEICPIDTCRIIDEKSLSIAKIFCELATDSHLPGQADKGPGFWRFLALRSGHVENRPETFYWLSCITGKATQAEKRTVAAIGEKLLAACPEIACFIHEERDKMDWLWQGGKRVTVLDALARKDASALLLPLAGENFSLDATSFFQVNNGAAEILAQTVMEMATKMNSGENLLDLYCGVGAPGQLLAGKFASLTGIEIDSRAITFAKRNANAHNLPNCSYLAGDAGKILATGKAKKEKWDAVLVDPPRAGIDAPALKAIMTEAPNSIIHISCNPATLARDAQKLQASYLLKEFRIVDMFPHTAHAEICSLWQKKH